MTDCYFYGKVVPEQDIVEGRLSLGTMLNAVDAVRVNALAEKIFELDENWKQINGTKRDLYAYYIISESTAEDFKQLTDEPIIYSPMFDVYLLCTRTFGMSYSDVYTDCLVYMATRHYGNFSCEAWEFDKREDIKVTLYGSTMKFDSRKKAIGYFEEGLRNSEGAEKDRYSYIIEQLENGDKEVDSDA